MSSLVITVKGEGSMTHLAQGSSNDSTGTIALANFLTACASGNENASIDVQTSSSDPVAASGTFTVVSAVATDAVTIGTVTLTASSTPANENQFEIDGADDDADAASLGAAINAHTTLSKVVVASVTDNVVTVTSLVKGEVGNQIPMSSADATITASGSFLTGGTGGATSAASTYRMGL